VSTGNLTITYFNSLNATIGSPDAPVALSGASTEITTNIPASAVYAQFEVVDNLNHKRTEQTRIGVHNATMRFAGILLSNSSGGSLDGTSTPTNFVMIPNTRVNLTFDVNAGCATPFTSAYIDEIRGSFQVNTITNQVVIALNNTQINNYMDDLDNDYSEINGSILHVMLDDLADVDIKNLVDVTVVEPTVTVAPTLVRVNASTPVVVGVNAYTTGIRNLNITVNDARFNGTTNATGSATITVNATAAGTLPVYIDGVETTKSVTAISLAGDANGDGDVNVIDLQMLAQAFFALSGDENFNPAVDFNNDGEINVIDLQILAGNYRV